MYLVSVDLILSPNITLLIGLSQKAELLFKIFVRIKIRIMIVQNINKNGGSSGFKMKEE